MQCNFAFSCHSSLTESYYITAITQAPLNIITTRQLAQINGLRLAPDWCWLFCHAGVRGQFNFKFTCASVSKLAGCWLWPILQRGLCWDSMSTPGTADTLKVNKLRARCKCQLGLWQARGLLGRGFLTPGGLIACRTLPGSSYNRPTKLSKLRRASTCSFLCDIISLALLFSRNQKSCYNNSKRTKNLLC